MPGNWTTTLESMKALEGHRGHMTHIQFHSYGGGEADENTFNSKTPAPGASAHGSAATQAATASETSGR